MYLEKSKLKNPLISFNSGPDFLKYLESVKKGIKPIPALVLLDLRMPLMDGFQVLSEVREVPMFDEIPIMIIFSNSNDEADIKKAKELRANGYQIKPSGSEEYIRFFNSLIAEFE
jgi:two-component system response regulator